MKSENLRILFVDDSQDDFELTREMLSSMLATRAQLDWAPGYAEALQRIREEQHDVYLVDFRLTGRTGIELLQEARRSGCRSPIILLTGQTGRDVDLEAMRLGAADYLDKSELSPRLLERSIRYALTQSEAQQRLLRRAVDAELMLQTASIAAERMSPDDALAQIAGAVCRTLGWIVGRVWRKEAGQHFVVTGQWSDDPSPAAVGSCGDDASALERAARTSRRSLAPRPGSSRMTPLPRETGPVEFAPAPDLLERAVETGEPEWVVGQAPATTSRLTVPVETGSGVAAVLEFISAEQTQPDDDRLKLIKHVAEQAGRILERHQADESLRRKELELRQAQKLEAIGLLASGVTHEFNNLMQSVQGYARFAMDGLAPEEPRSHDLRQVLVAAERASKLTQQLLGFTRAQPLERTLIEPAVAIQELLTMLRPMIGTQIEVSFRSARSLQPLLADRAMFQQLLMNLCINARDAMPNGGKLTISAHSVLADEDLARQLDVEPGRYFRLVVSDTGCGMTPEVQQRIFDPFFTTKEVGKGTGLGMATVYGIVQQHRGALQVNSELGAGTSISVYIPASSGEHAPPSRVAGPTVLVADDEPLVRDLSARALRQAGYDVLTADNGQQAVEVFEEHLDVVELVVLDMVMPKLTGWQAYERISRLRAEIPVIFCTGYNPDSNMNEDQLPATATILRKPFPLAALTHEIGRQLGNLSDSHSPTHACFPELCDA